MITFLNHFFLWLKMADLVAALYKHAFRKERIFRDRTNPLEYYSPSAVFNRYGFWLDTIYAMAEIFESAMGPLTELSHSLPTLLSVCGGLRYLRVGSFYLVMGDLRPEIDKATAHRVQTAVSKTRLVNRVLI